MKYVKMLGLAAVAAMALMAFVGVGTASATGGVLCENTTEPCNSKWAVNSHMSFHLKAGTSAKLSTTGGTELKTCTSSTVTGKVETAGSSTEKARGTVEAKNLTWGGCNGALPVTVTPGKLTATGLGGGKGTIYADGFSVRVEILGVECHYTAGTTLDLGTFTPGASDLDGILAINTVVSRDEEHVNEFLCPASARWQGEYTQTGSTPLAITKS